MKKIKNRAVLKNSLPKKFYWETVNNVHSKITSFVKETKGSLMINTYKGDNYVLSEKVCSKSSSPPFTNSAVDGWALKGPLEKREYQIPILSDIIDAGNHKEIFVPDGYAIKILTGAKLPKGTDTVILKENVDLNEKIISFKGAIKKGLNTRLKGEDIKKGDSLFEKGHLLRPQDLGLLISAGLTKIKCKKKLRLGLFSTGDEISHLNNKSKFEKNSNIIFDANRPMLHSLYSRWNIDVIDYGIIDDDYNKVVKKLNFASGEVDLLVTTGGVSTGDKDFISKFLNDFGTLKVWRVAIKPGRPIAIGLFNKKPFFALPGNPVAAFVCSLIFLYPALNSMLGRNFISNMRYRLRSNFVKEKMIGRTEYLRGKLNQNGTVDIFPSEGSGRISGLTWSNGLIELDHDLDNIQKGDFVNFIPYSYFNI